MRWFIDMLLKRVMLLSDSNDRSHVIYCAKRINDSSLERIPICYRTKSDHGLTFGVQYLQISKMPFFHPSE